MGCFPNRKSGQNFPPANKENVKLETSVNRDKSVSANVIQVQTMRKTIKRESCPKYVKINKAQFIQQHITDPFLKYDKIDVLGEGAYGKVYKVKSKLNNLIYAMKVIKRKSSVSSEEERNKIIKEINILKTLDHPNIVKIFEFFILDSTLYIITEYCEGGELFDKIIKFKYFNERVAAKIMIQLLSAVDFCHKNNIIHRDLKPENILLDSSDDELSNLNIKIIDFGTGEIYRQGGQLLNKQIGTPYYIAPEVLNNAYNEKCDIWSCGVIMYILLCGCPPFYGKNDVEIYKAIKLGYFEYKHNVWTQISDEGKNLIKSLLTQDIKMRPSAEKAIQHKWFKYTSSDTSGDLTDTDFETLHSLNTPVTNFKFGLNLKEALKNLKNFKAERKLQQATLYFLVQNGYIQNEEVKQLTNIFKTMDKNNDGRLTKEEIKLGYKMSKTMLCSKEEVEMIFDRVDVDRNGYIEIQEFLLACLDLDKVLTDINLSTAFKMFDRDSSGKISANELKSVLGFGNEEEDEEVWMKLINEIDCDLDGEISYEEFKQMMYNLVSYK